MSKTEQKVDSLDTLINNTAQEVMQEFAGSKLEASELAITLVDLSTPGREKTANFRGDERIIPASVVKLFYLVAAHRWLEDGKLTETEELKRAMQDMIVDSSNDATHYILDLLTGTTGGPELSADEMRNWVKKRNAVNEYFASCGYTSINVCQKTWGDGPFGREREFVGKDYENRNKLNTNAAARLIVEIVTGKAFNAKRSRSMMDLLKRDFGKSSDDPDNQASGFTGAVLPADAKLWSKAGWTSTLRHDATYIELANGKRFVLVTFNTNHPKEYGIIQSVAKKCIAGLSALDA